MFFTGLTHPFKAIHHLLATIASQVEPGILFNGHIPIDPPHTECFFPPYFLQNIFFVIGRRNGLSQAFQIFPYKSIRHLSISIGGKIQYFHQIFPHMLTEQIPNDRLIFRGKHLLKNIVLFFTLHLFPVFVITADQDKSRHPDHNNHGRHATKIHDHSYKKADDKCSSCSNKPTTDHREHTGHPEYGTLPSPGPIGQRTTHSHHKSDISR